MFTGLVETTAMVSDVQRSASDRSLRLTLDASGLSNFDCRLGDSVAVNGCCLTVVKIDDQHLTFDVSKETLAKTNIGALQVSEVCNIERAARFSDRIGGHIVLGHIDGTAETVCFEHHNDGSLLEIKLERALAKYCIMKGSICIDGISLTINNLVDHPTHSILSFMIIPHTMQKTTLKARRIPYRFNIEVDIMAKFTERASLFGG